MLQKERSNQTAMMKYGLIAPLFMLMIVVSSATLASKQLAKIEEKVEEFADGNLAEVVESPSKSVTEVLADENLDLSKALIISPDLVDEVKISTSFSKYLARNLRYPLKAQKELITGMSSIGFTVNNAGKILNIKTLKEKNSILSGEVERVLESIENATTLGLSEPKDYVISVNFGLEINKGNGTSQLLSSEPIMNFEGRKKLDDIVVIGYTENISKEIKRDTNEVFTAVEQPAEFQGGMDAFVKFLQENIKYPEPARRANHGGKVYTQFTVNTDGTISDVTILKSVGFGCDEEAMRVIKLAKWTPGKQSGRVLRNRIIVPINFELGKEPKVKINKKDNEEFPKLPAVMEFKPYNGALNSTNIVLNSKCKDCPPPLYIVDGVESQSQNTIKDLDPNDIESISILKDKKAIDEYGEKGKNGVIVITSKKK